MVIEPQVISPADTARLVRRMLKATFDHAFRVQVKPCSPFKKLEIAWEDGPYSDAVLKACAAYQGYDNDGTIIVNTNLDGTRERYDIRFISQVHRFSTPEKERQAIERVYDKNNK